MRKMYILTLRLFETLVVCHICKSTIVEFDWKFSFFSLPPSWGARVAWWEWVRALAFQQCGPGSNPGVDALRGSEFVVGSLPCSERFFIGHSGFPLSPQKPTLQSKFQFDLEWRTRLNEFIRTRWCFVGKQITICNLQSFRPFQHLPQKAMMLTDQNYTLPLTCNILLAASCTVSMSLLLATRPPMDDGTPAG